MEKSTASRCAGLHMRARVCICVCVYVYVYVRRTSRERHPFCGTTLNTVHKRGTTRSGLNDEKELGHVSQMQQRRCVGRGKNAVAAAFPSVCPSVPSVRRESGAREMSIASINDTCEKIQIRNSYQIY